jgi:dienelactone hydrolase
MAKPCRKHRATFLLLLARWGLALACLLLPACATRELPALAAKGASVRKPGDSPPPESRFVRFEIALPGSGRAYPVWRTRAPGRPLLLLHPINGLSPDCLRLALELEQWGYRVYLPSLYGDPVGREPAYGYNRELASIKVIRRAGTWNPLSTESTGPIVEDVAALARAVSGREGGRRLAVVGNSLTGSFPLALLDEPCVGLAVLGQPAVPVKRVPQILLRLPQAPSEREALPLDEEKWGKVLAAMRRHPGKRIVGFHYEDDPIASIPRFDTLRERLAGAGLGSRFTAYVASPPGSGYASARPWVVARETAEIQRMLTPHSTYLDAADEADRAWFRQRLRAELAKGW